MGREVKRVPLDFEHPLSKTWPGFLSPDTLDGVPCPDCDSTGYSPYARQLNDLWYGNGVTRFNPTETGSVAWTATTPIIRARAERNLGQAPEFYGTGERALTREAQRLADLFNAAWSNHLSQEDVDALVESNRLMDFTHTFTRGKGWQPRDPRPVVTAAAVNEWSISGGLGHDSVNRWVCVKARCKAMGVSDTCESCDGHGSTEAYPGQRAAADAWEHIEPPTGEGWQLWETVSEGSPISPVFPDPEGLADWMSSPEYHWGSSRPMEYHAALAFVREGWAPTLVQEGNGPVQNGEVYIGETAR
jgi:hypothetical protein